MSRTNIVGTRDIFSLAGEAVQTRPTNWFALRSENQTHDRWRQPLTATGDTRTLGGTPVPVGTVLEQRLSACRDKKGPFRDLSSYHRYQPVLLEAGEPESVIGIFLPLEDGQNLVNPRYFDPETRGLKRHLKMTIGATPIPIGISYRFGVQHQNASDATPTAALLIATGFSLAMQMAFGNVASPQVPVDKWHGQYRHGDYSQGAEYDGWRRLVVSKNIGGVLPRTLADSSLCHGQDVAAEVGLGLDGNGFSGFVFSVSYGDASLVSLNAAYGDPHLKNLKIVGQYALAALVNGLRGVFGASVSLKRGEKPGAPLKLNFDNGKGKHHLHLGETTLSEILRTSHERRVLKILEQNGIRTINDYQLKDSMHALQNILTKSQIEVVNALLYRYQLGHRASAALEARL